MFRTDDPVAEFERYDAELEDAIELLPTCAYCGEKITDDFLYEINDETICESCLNDQHRKLTTDFIL